MGVAPLSHVRVAGSESEPCPERWNHRTTTEAERARTDQSFLVPKSEIAENGYGLSLNRYKEVVYDEVEHKAPAEIIVDLELLEAFQRSTGAHLTWSLATPLAPASNSLNQAMS